ncbi:Transient receptor potential cation channel subfamily C member [Nesidiocoris tenuis]|uniref:Transient receptor potential cation channel subfamily C member n=1 Tax=Nesidiocoris tenuis TaxID=355587 RepID=A0ABN7BGL0_9HEMI|nr:Transient receptor potential cation channel subfamily C member [Nesidiocoris tenuis]
MRNLVRRYVTVEQRKAESEGVTEDDVNEIKQDISAFRCELIEILRQSGMNTSTATGSGTGAGGKKNRQKERRLMKGFNIAPPPSSANVTGGVSPQIADALAALAKTSSNEHLNSAAARLGAGPGASIRRKYKDNLSKLMFRSSGGAGGGKRRWDSLIEVAKSAKVSRFISQSRSEDSVCGDQRSPNSENLTDTDSNASGKDALSALKKKRQVFHKSRYTPNESSSVDVEEKCEKKVLKRASSVPVQGRNDAMPVDQQNQHHQIHQQHHRTCVDRGGASISGGGLGSAGTSGKNVDDFKDRNGMIMPSLPPGIQPVSGHNIATGWL